MKFISLDANSLDANYANTRVPWNLMAMNMCTMIEDPGRNL